MNTRLRAISLLFLAFSVACAYSPVPVQVNEDDIEVAGYSIPLRGVVIRGYENIPTPTTDPQATAQPTITPTPRPSLTPRPTPTERPTPTLTPMPQPAARLTHVEWLNPTVFSQYFGQNIALEGTLVGFNEGRADLWLHEYGVTGNDDLSVSCNFPDGWARANAEMLYAWRDQETPIIAMGKMAEWGEPRLGKDRLNHMFDLRYDGFSGCTLAPAQDPPTQIAPVALLTASQYMNDAVFSQYLGQTIAMEGILDGFDQYDGSITVRDIDGRGEAGIGCHFPQWGWFKSNAEMIRGLWEARAPVIAVGTIPTKYEIPVGSNESEADMLSKLRHRLWGCTLEPAP